MKIKMLIASLFTVCICTMTTLIIATGNVGDLEKLTINREGLEPAFNENITMYSIFVPINVEKIDIVAIPKEKEFSVEITGNENLVEGDNIININVISPKGKIEKNYKIVVTKSRNFENSDSYLLNLIVENAILAPKFTSQNLIYDCGKVASNVNKLKILAFPNNEEAKVEIIGNDELKFGENKIDIKVVSKDLKTNKSYSINVVRESDDKNSLSNVEEEQKNIDKSNKVSIFEMLKNFYIKNMGIINVALVVVLVFIGLLVFKKSIKKK
ncbi:MAG: cadherin-like beta sandwich domain-containing protein [Clostridia bacterium]